MSNQNFNELQASLEKLKLLSYSLKGSIQTPHNTQPNDTYREQSQIEKLYTSIIKPEKENYQDSLNQTEDKILNLMDNTFERGRTPTGSVFEFQREQFSQLNPNESQFDGFIDGGGSFGEEKGLSTFSFKERQEQSSVLETQPSNFKQNTFRSTNGFDVALRSTATNFRRTGESMNKQNRNNIEDMNNDQQAQLIERLKEQIEELYNEKMELEDELKDYEESFDRAKFVIKTLKRELEKERERNSQVDLLQYKIREQEKIYQELQQSQYQLAHKYSKLIELSRKSLEEQNLEAQENEVLCFKYQKENEQLRQVLKVTVNMDSELEQIRKDLIEQEEEQAQRLLEKEELQRKYVTEQAMQTEKKQLIEQAIQTDEQQQYSPNQEYERESISFQLSCSDFSSQKSDLMMRTLPTPQVGSDIVEQLKSLPSNNQDDSNEFRKKVHKKNKSLTIESPSLDSNKPTSFDTNNSGKTMVRNKSTASLNSPSNTNMPHSPSVSEFISPSNSTKNQQSPQIFNKGVRVIKPPISRTPPQKFRKQVLVQQVPEENKFEEIPEEIQQIKGFNDIYVIQEENNDIKWAKELTSASTGLDDKDHDNKVKELCIGDILDVIGDDNSNPSSNEQSDPVRMEKSSQSQKRPQFFK